MDNNVAQNTLKFAIVTSLFTKRAMEALQASGEKQAAAAAAAPPVLDRMVKVAALDASQKKYAEDHLATHAGTLRVLDWALDVVEKQAHQINSERASELGAPEASEKSASAPYGAAESDDAFRKILDPAR